jgi:hypothetical protein
MFNLPFSQMVGVVFIILLVLLCVGGIIAKFAKKCQNLDCRSYNLGINEKGELACNECKQVYVKD